MNIIGIDPSLTATGVATAAGQLTIATRTGDRDRRLRSISDTLARIIRAENIEVAAIEDLPTHAHGAGITGMAQGVIRLTLIAAGVPYATIPPAVVKKYATGKGNATKADMRMALYQRAGLDLRDDNQVDAWWLRAAGHQLAGTPIIELPKAQVAALAKLDPIAPVEAVAADAG